MKYLLLVALVLVSGCSALDYMISDQGDALLAGGKTVASGFGLAGTLGFSVITLALGLYKDSRTKKSKIELIKKLSQDTYGEFKSMSDSDKAKLDAKIRSMVPDKYQKHYDKAKVYI